MKEMLALIGVGIVLWLIVFYPAMRIVRKAGYSRWLTLLFLVPILLLWFMAFAEWPLNNRDAEK